MRGGHGWMHKTVIKVNEDEHADKKWYKLYDW